MADEEQLRILSQGVEAWNDWRREAGEDVHIDLREANLRGADVHGANLSEAEHLAGSRRGCCLGSSEA